MFKANSGSEWQNVVSQTGQPKIFTGNTDRNGVVRNLLPSPVRARFVRIVPVTWKSHICMRFELLGDGPVTPDMKIHRLGIEDKSVPDFSLTASSCYRGSTRYCAPRARLNTNQKNYYVGGWRAAKSDPNQWIKVDLGAVYQITGVITQGRQEIRPRLNQWVTTFKLSYSLNGKDWLFAAACENGDKIFVGNNDRDGEMVNDINPPLMARFVRIHPLTWHNAISLRWELSGRGPFIGMSTTTMKQKVSLSARRIVGSVFSASSQWNARYSASQAHASSRRSGGWIAKTNDMNQWLQIKLPQKYTVTGVITQGQSHYCQWVEAFKVMYGNDGKNWKTITQTGSSEPEIFIANDDRRTKKTSMFVPPITASYVRIVPTDWAGHISMRAELLGSPLAPAWALRATGVALRRLR
ncbi:lactadherin-like [Diadema setosum]|uniref:lactadherin-like n=1 Tax=Diadema setosum TaxID=31175 RepID=UPI003B3A176B